MSAGGQDCTPARGVSTLKGHTAGRVFSRDSRLPLYRARLRRNRKRPVDVTKITRERPDRPRRPVEAPRPRSESRGASRLRRGASERRGGGGPVEASRSYRRTGLPEIAAATRGPALLVPVTNLNVGPSAFSPITPAM